MLSFPVLSSCARIKTFCKKGACVTGSLLLHAVSGISEAPNPLPEIIVDQAGTIDGQFEVSDSGAATYDIKIAVPPGTNGMVPDLQLSYNSGGSEGFIGQRWSLSGLSQITRCAKTIAQDGAVGAISFSVHDALCLDGKRILRTTGQAGEDGAIYQPEIEDFTKVTAHGSLENPLSSFTAYARNGLIYRYGSSSNTRLVGGGHTLPTAWLLSDVSDRSGNTIDIVYGPEIANGEAYPVRIDYTKNTSAGLTAYNSVRFTYTQSTAPSTRFLGGGRFVSTKRLTRISMYTQEILAWEYRLEYEQDPLLYVDQLSRVTECDADGICLPSTTFSWIRNSTQQLERMPATGSFGPRDFRPHLPLAADWDGDGIQDPSWAHPLPIGFMLSRPNHFLRYPGGDQSWIEGQLQGMSPSQIITGDFNADGRTDIGIAAADSDSRRHQFETLLAHGNSFISGPFIQSGFESESPGSDRTSNRIFGGDWDGDGRTDVARVLTNRVIFFRNSGSGFTPYATIDGPDPLNPYPNPVDSQYPLLMGDWDGDGRTDFGRVGLLSDYVAYFVTYRSTGAGFVIHDIRPPLRGISPKYVADFNGDGLSDIGFTDHFGTDICFSNGTSFSDCVSGFAGALPPQHQSETDLMQPVLIGDFNGDGAADIARVQYRHLNVWSIRNLQPQSPIDIAELSHEETAYFAGETQHCSGFGCDPYGFSMGDIDGDGRQDLYRLRSESGDMNHPYSMFLRQPGTTPNLISHITNGLSASIEIRYQPLTTSGIHERLSGSVYPRVDIQAPITVVQAVRSSNGIGGVFEESFRYVGLRSNLDGRGSSGFARIERYNVSQGRYTITHYRQDFPFTGSPFRQEEYLNNGTLIGRTTTTWEQRSLPFGRVLPLDTRRISESFEPNSGILFKSTTTDTAYDAFGNISLILKTNSDGTSERTENTYQNDTENWLLGKLVQAVVTQVSSSVPAEEGGTVQRTASFSYNDQGLLLDETIEPNHPTLWYRKLYRYDAFGNMIEIRRRAADVSETTERTDYDPRGQFILAKTNQLNHRSEFEYDVRHGKPTLIRDINNLVQRNEFDAFGRLYREYFADGTEQRTTYHRSFAEIAGNRAAYFVRIDRSGTAPALTFYDNLNREIARQTTNFSGATVLTERVFDAAGRLASVSEPYHIDLGEQPLRTIFRFDLASRVIRTEAPGNRITLTEYDGLTTIMTDPRGNNTTRTTDIEGRPLAVTDALNGTSLYTYDGAGNLHSVTDPAGNIAKTRYDVRGNKIWSNDPASGITHYQYNALGAVTRTEDARGQVQYFEHDALGRMIRRRSNEGYTQWIFDTGANGIGKLARIENSDGYRETYSYDQLSRVATLSRVIAARSFTQQFSYDAYGRLSREIYPSGFSTIRSYTDRGFLRAITRADTGSTIWEAQSMTARGQLAVERYGNGLITRSFHKPDSGLLDRRAIIRTDPDEMLQQLAFDYDLNGNLSMRADSRTGAETFEYDPLNRLSRARIDSDPTPTYISYDAIGNILSRSDVGTYRYGERGYHSTALTSITGTKPNTYNYDAAGNRTSSATGTVEYSAAGVPLLIRDNGSTIRFLIDGAGQRARMITQNAQGTVLSTRYYVGKGYEEIETAKSRELLHYISSPEGLVAIVTYSKSSLSPSAQLTSFAAQGGIEGFITSEPLSSPASGGGSATQIKTRYIHRDHLGSPHLITDEQGQIAELLSFDPWGMRRDPATRQVVSPAPKSSTIRGFTGHEHLDAVQLIHMNGRVYDPVVGRFLSPDPFIQSIENSQNLNRYSYVLNNPLSITDPTGFFFKRLFRSIGRTIGSVGRIALVTAVAVASGGSLVSAFGSLGPVMGMGLSGAGAGIASSVTGSLLNGKSLREGFRAGIRAAPMNAFSAIAANQIGDVFFEGDARKPAGIGAKAFGKYSESARAVAHGLSNGVVRAASGGKFGQGFTHGFVSTLAGQLGEYGPILGGAAAAALTGGKLAEGAMSGSVIYLYNDSQHQTLWEKASTRYEAFMDNDVPAYRAWVDRHESTLRTLGYGSAAVSLAAGLGALAVGGPIGVALWGAAEIATITGASLAFVPALHGDVAGTVNSAAFSALGRSAELYGARTLTFDTKSANAFGLSVDYAAAPWAMTTDMIANQKR